MTLAEMLVAPWHGNFNSDSILLRELGDFAQDAKNSIEDRAKAIRRIDEVMGWCNEQTSKTDFAVVSHYMAVIREI